MLIDQVNASSSSSTGAEPKSKRAKKNHVSAGIADPAYQMDSAHRTVYDTLNGGTGAHDIDQMWSDFTYTNTQMNKSVRDGNFGDLLEGNVIMVQMVRLMEIQTAIALGMTPYIEHEEGEEQQQQRDH